MRSYRSRLRALVDLALAQLWYYRRRTVLATLGVALAVLAIAVLVGLGTGVSAKGTAGIADLHRDLWMGAPVHVAPAAVGGVDNGLLDAHEVARSVEARSDVRRAQAVGFQSVYVGTNGSEFETIAGVGVTGSSAPIPLIAGDGFSATDAHYADGNYDGPATREIIVDERIAAARNVSVGDTLSVGGTIATARDNEYEIVGITPAISTFVGVPTVVTPLAELQALTGTTGTDPAAYVTITLPSDADPNRVATDLERAYPDYEVRTNREQFETIVAGYTPAIASAVAIATIAALLGMALVVIALGLLIHHQRAELGALLATGVSVRTLVATSIVQGSAIGALGGVLGIAAAVPVAAALNGAMSALTGFDGLVVLRPWVLLLAVGVALGMGLFGSAAASRRITRLDPIAQLR